MKTATKKPIDKPASNQTIRERIQGILRSDDGLQSEREKLADLRRDAAVCQSNLDQATAAVADVDGLAERLLSGGDVVEHDDAFAKRQSLAHKMEAYRLALSRQEGAVEVARIAAGPLVLADMEPIARDRRERFIESVAEMASRLDDWLEVLEALASASVSHDNNPRGLSTVKLAIRQIQAITKLQ